MEIPRQKKTVRVAVTRPSVKKGAIVTLLKTDARKPAWGERQQENRFEVWSLLGGLLQE